MDLNIYGYLGLIMLIGIVKKNAIMMIDFALDAEREQGISAEEAITQAALTRFRPIMMTTMAAFMGGLPIAMGIGAGAESRQPLGLTVVGGLILSQTVTLFITPVFYIYLDAFQDKFLKGRKSALTPGGVGFSLPVDIRARIHVLDSVPPATHRTTVGGICHMPLSPDVCSTANCRCPATEGDKSGSILLFA